MRLVFLGTAEIGVPSLEFFVNKDDIEVLCVVTQPDRPSGRGYKLTASPVKQTAEKYGLKVFQPKSIRKDAELIKTLKDLQPDFFITIAFGQILNEEVLAIPKYGTINLHASLLPKYRGPNPIQQAIVNGEKVTGVTAMLTDIGIDTGDILIKEEIKITENMTSIELTQKMSAFGPEILYKSMKGLIDKTLTPVKQDNERATHASKFKKEDGKINFCGKALSIHNKVRGMQPSPGTFCNFKGNLIKILETEIPKNNKEKINSGKCGQIVDIINSGIGVYTADGLIVITKLQPAGKKPMDGASWYRGVTIAKGDKLE